jgi:hypothetical protein
MNNLVNNHTYFLQMNKNTVVLYNRIINEMISVGNRINEDNN